MKHKLCRPVPPLLLLVWLVGCDDRVTEVAREAADRQAQQNETMAQLQGQVAEGTKQLVEADAESRKEMIGVHRDLQEERSRLDQTWDELHDLQRSDSVWLSLIPTVGIIAVVCMLLGFCWYVLLAAHSEDVTSSEINELLLEQLSDTPQLPLETVSLAALPDSSADESSES